MMRKIVVATLLALFWSATALAVPETVSVRVTDVTTSSFAVIWMTDVPATPALEVYSDAGMVNRLPDGATVTPMPDATPEVAAAARARGIMKARVAGLAPDTTYYVRTVTTDPANPASVGYSGLQQVRTAAKVVTYRAETDGTLRGIGNDQLSFKVYIRPSEAGNAPGLGDLILVETAGAANPLSAFVGAGVAAPEGILDLNNLFGTDRASLALTGGEKSQLAIYRGGTLSTLIHYRRIPVPTNLVSVGEPVRGFFADINLDGKVDEQDFEAFRKQYRTAADDAAFNPDYNFIGEATGVIDAQDFAKFAREYGRTDVQ